MIVRSGVDLTNTSIVRRYSGVCVLVVVMNLVRFFVVCWLGLRGSEALHKSLLLNVMGAPLTFFHVTERGRITSRFSSDFDAIDLVIPSSISSFIDAIFSMLASLLVIVGTSPAFLVFIVPIAVAYNRIQLTYRASAKEVSIHCRPYGVYCTNTTPE